MPIIMKGEMIIKNTGEHIPAPPEEKKQAKEIVWNNEFKRISNKKIKKDIVEEVKPEITSHYHEEHHGDLHKLYNTKSHYLSDMVALKDS